jgi:hypothetical protein
MADPFATGRPKMRALRPLHALLPCLAAHLQVLARALRARLNATWSIPSKHARK